MNIARIYYAEKSFEKAIEYYAKIPRNSENWLPSLLEASWAFLLLKKANNSLGNVHTLKSPFFSDRFFPEAYIVEAISYLRMCRYEATKRSVNLFNKKYSILSKDLRDVLNRNVKSPSSLVRAVYQYSTSDGSKKRRPSWEIFEHLSRTPANKQVVKTTMVVDDELMRIKILVPIGVGSGLLRPLQNF